MDAPPFELTDAVILATDDDLTLTALNAEPETVRYVAVQTPDYFNGILTVASTPGQGRWDFDLFDAVKGLPIGKNEIDRSSNNSTETTFTVGAGRRRTTCASRNRLCPAPE